MSVDFKAKQLEFTQYIRNPATNPVPADVKPERMAMYRELIFNNIEGFLTGNFPVIRTLLDDQQWYDLAQDFFPGIIAKHRTFPTLPKNSSITWKMSGIIRLITLFCWNWRTTNGSRWPYPSPKTR